MLIKTLNTLANITEPPQAIDDLSARDCRGYFFGALCSLGLGVTTTTTTICGDACPLSCASAEA